MSFKSWISNYISMNNFPIEFIISKVEQNVLREYEIQLQYEIEVEFKK